MTKEAELCHHAMIKRIHYLLFHSPKVLSVIVPELMCRTENAPVDSAGRHKYRVIPSIPYLFLQIRATA